MKNIFCIMGPTASGKTALAIELVKRFPYEIISVDSSMVYRGMDIGSAKPSREELAIAPHRLINIRNPDEIYSAADFRRDALKEIMDILQANKIPLLVGGTMLYFKALQQGLSALPEADATVRASLLAEANEKGWQYMHDQLRKIDPIAAARIHPNDPQRLQRALEVHAISGKTLTTLLAEDSVKVSDYSFINIGLLPDDRELLRDNIAKRFETMLQQGLVQEVENLFAQYHHELPAMRAVGYRQVWDYLSGKTSFDEMKFLAITATRQLAKRQMTWLRSWPDLQVFNCQAINLVKEITNLI